MNGADVFYYASYCIENVSFNMFYVNTNYKFDCLRILKRTLQTFNLNCDGYISLVDATNHLQYPITISSNLSRFFPEFFKNQEKMFLSNTSIMMSIEIFIKNEKSTYCLGGMFRWTPWVAHSLFDIIKYLKHINDNETLLNNDNKTWCMILSA